jgi:hypothetical protein
VKIQNVQQNVQGIISTAGDVDLYCHPNPFIAIFGWDGSSKWSGRRFDGGCVSTISLKGTPFQLDGIIQALYHGTDQVRGRMVIVKSTKT